MKKMLLFSISIVLLTCTMAQPTSGLVAYWNMNGNFSDFGPNGISGTNFSATATTNTFGAVNTAMSFASPTSVVAQYATHPINANLNFGINQDFSIDFSIFTTDLSHPGGIYDNNLNLGGPGIFIWNANGFPQIIFNFKNASALTTNGALPLNLWKHVCCVRQGATTKIYVNGVLNVTSAPGTLVPTYTLPGQFGTMSSSTLTPPQYNGYNGKIDEMRIYNRALTAAEITSLFAITLPIKLHSFTATKNNDDVLLQWQTEYEQNSSHFDIQRSTDGINFNTIATTPAKGNTGTQSQYQFTDNTTKSLAAVKTVFYRLQMVDKDASKENSAVVSIKLNAEQKELMVLQNPVSNNLQLQFYIQQKQATTISITNATGSLVYTQQMVLNAGTISTVIPVKNLAAGNYFVTLINAQGKQTKAFVK